MTGEAEHDRGQTAFDEMQLLPNHSVALRWVGAAI